MARNGFKVFDSDTHVGPHADILERYTTADVKERLKALRTMVDVLTLSATPIPRTLASSMRPRRCPGALISSGMPAISGRLPGVAARCGSPAVKLAPWSDVTTTSDRSY